MELKNRLEFMEYQVFSISVRGEIHRAKNIVMQDFSGHEDADEAKIAVVSDGHGDKNCFRSDKGSQFAVKACLEGMKSYVSESVCLEEEERFSQNSLRQLCAGIAKEWNLAVKEDLERNPLSEEELQSCDSEWAARYRQGNRVNHVYGATLIGMALFKDWLLVLHQGDGKCVVISQEGEFSEPVPWDERCFLNATTSLCDRDVVQAMRIYMRNVREKPIAAVFAASDGVEDSYNNTDVMYNFYRRLCMYAVENGMEEMCAHYREDELPQISQMGSGDDMSVAGFLNLNMLERLLEIFEQDIVYEQNLQAAQNAKDRMDSMENKRKYLAAQCRKKEQERALLEQEVERTKKEIEKQKKRYEELTVLCGEISEEYKRILDEYNAYENKYASYEKVYQEAIKDKNKSDMV